MTNNFWFYIKCVVTLLISFVTTICGGVDAAFLALLGLMALDIVSGILYAWLSKTMSSTKLRQGFVNKCGYFIGIFTCVGVDILLKTYTGQTPQFSGHDILVRNVAIAYLCFQELISIFENLGLLGVPYPKSVMKVLIQVNESVDKVDTSTLLGMIKKIFHITISLGDKSSSSDETSENSETDSKL